MSASRTLSLALSLPFLAPMGLAASGEVWLVATDGSGDFTTIQEAVGVATAGDVVLVRAGSYAPFEVRGQALTIAADQHQTVSVEGTIVVRNIGAGETVVLAGLSAAGVPSDAPDSNSGLYFVESPGTLLAQGCEFFGAAAAAPDGMNPCGSGIRATLVGHLVLTDCLAVGGTADYGTDPRDGGNGIETGAAGVPWQLSMYECVVRGGRGANDDLVAGDGGEGIDGWSVALFAAGCEIHGGDGGDAPILYGGSPGYGGGGISLIDPGMATLLDNVIEGGYDGCDPCGNQAQPVYGPHQYLSGEARTATIPSVVNETTQVELLFRGVPGDRVALLASPRTGDELILEWSGVLALLDPASHHWLPRGAGPTSRLLELDGPLLGTIPSSGSLLVQVDLAALRFGLETDRVFVQPLHIAPDAAVFLGEPAPLSVVGCGFGPDCNGNGVADACDIESGTSLDLDGDGIPDECTPALYVDAGAPPGGDGLSWSTAFQRLQDALAIVLPGAYQEIWVAEGSYTPAPPGGDRYASFDLPDRVRLYGGFAGDETSRDQRDPQAHPTLLNGDLDGDDLPDFGNYGDNSYHVLRLHGLSSDTLVDGFVIRGGNANHPADGDYFMGGGVHIEHGAPRIVGCTIELNFATHGGGGAWILNAQPVFEGCRFVGNRVPTSGAGLQSVTGASPSLVRCTFLENEAGGSGGAISNVIGTVQPMRVQNCSFLGNSATTGGAVSTGTDIELVNCLFSGNTATNTGAGLRCYTASPVIESCTFSLNRAENTGGGIHTSNAPPLIEGSIFWGNRDATGNTEGAQIPPNSVVTYSCIQDLNVHAGNGNIGAFPFLADPQGPDGSAGTEDDDARLLPGSPCIDAADVAALPSDFLDLDGDGDTSEPIPLDRDDVPRRVDDPAAPDTGNGPAPVVDMGAYERQLP